MDSCQSKQRYDRPPPPPETQKKLGFCGEKAGGITPREVRSPPCNFVIDKMFFHAKGHFLSKCPKCKAQYVMNFAYFRRQKGIRRLKVKYYGDDYFKKMNNK